MTHFNIQVMENHEIESFVVNFKNLLLNDEKIEKNTEFKKLESWDSLFILELIMMIDEKYQKKVNPTMILNSSTIFDLFINIQAI